MFDFIKKALGYWRADKVTIETKPRDPHYDDIFESYKRSFSLKCGAYYVGNHRLVNGFDPYNVIHTFAFNKFNGKYDNYLIDTWYQSEDEHTEYFMLVVMATGERLNNMIPYAKEPATFKNFLEQLHQEYKKNLADVMSERYGQEVNRNASK